LNSIFLLYGYKNRSKTAQTAYLTKQAVLEKDCGEDGFYDNGDSLVENSKTLATRALDTIERLMSEPCASKNGEGGIRTRAAGYHPLDGLANRCLQPLGHLSEQSSDNLHFVSSYCKKISIDCIFLQSPHKGCFTFNDRLS
jgi:hypothetical protein